MKYLILTVGLPYSGKSTWARQQPYPVVNRDSVRYALHGNRFLAAAEPMVAVITQLMVKALFLAGHETVIVDECHNTRKRRDAWKSDAWMRHFVVFDASREECLRRAGNGKQLLDGGQQIRGVDEEILPVIERMAAEYEPVAEDEEDQENQVSPADIPNKEKI